MIVESAKLRYDNSLTAINFWEYFVASISDDEMDYAST